MPGLSIHVIDVVRGLPAQGMRVEVFRIDEPVRVPHDRGEIGHDGVARLSATDGERLPRGIYEIELDVGSFYRALGEAVGAPAFQETVVYRFTVVDPDEHYHLPIKLSPWGISIWRGR